MKKTKKFLLCMSAGILLAPCALDFQSRDQVLANTQDSVQIIDTNEEIQKIENDYAILSFKKQIKENKIAWYLNISGKQECSNVKIHISQTKDGESKIVTELESEVTKEIISADESGDLTIPVDSKNTYVFFTDLDKKVSVSASYSKDGNYLPMIDEEKIIYEGNSSVTEESTGVQESTEVTDTDVSEETVSSESNTETSSTDTSESDTSMTKESTNSSNSTNESEDKSEEKSQDSMSEKVVADEHPEIRGSGKYGSVNVPSGAITIWDLFSVPIGPAKVEYMQNPYDNEGRPYSEVSLSGTRNWTALWSKRSNRLDFSHSFRGRTYVNFGTKEADGFAFVMQNDPRKETAITNAQSSSDGQNLGVYGAKEAYTKGISTKVTPEKDAVQKSVAIEFDLYTNKRSLGETLYDLDPSEPDKVFKAPHMAYSFPGNLNKTYVPLHENESDANQWFGTLGSLQAREARIIHRGKQKLNETVSQNVQDGTWYEFRFGFNADTKVFSYYLKNPVTDQQTEVITIPWSDLNEELDLANNDNKAYWGFTAANGGESGQTKIVFTEVPVNLDATLKNDVLNEKNESITVSEEDTTKEKSVSPGSEVTLTSKLYIDKGENSFTVDSWNVFSEEEVEVYDLSTVKDVVIKAPSGDILAKGTPKVEDGKLNITFDQDVTINPEETLDFSLTIQTKQDIQQDTHVQFYGVVNGTENSVPAEEKSFSSNPVYFWITKKDSMTELSWNESSIEKTKNQQVDIADISDEGMDTEFFWKDIDTNDLLEFTLFKDNEQLIRKEVTTSGENKFNIEKLIIPKNKLSYGGNNFTIQVKKLNPNGSNEILDKLILNVEVAGSLYFETAPADVSWTNRVPSQTKGILSRDKDNSIQLSVRDSRNIPDQDKNWFLILSLCKEKEDSFEYVWKPSTNSDLVDLGTTSLKVMDTNSALKDNYNYYNEWNSQEGILLKSKEYISIGDYSHNTKFVWNLCDTAIPK
ncbi:hypothetical protein CUS87_06840 [Enterococcus faecium]|uniref:lectin-like domain-containing protein n=1 Tax=Enterococcus faecium TaxID=1352 RepID=UPI000CF2CD42|nr:hypothetical protein [Enterococcus faecium]PQF34263.1 hypothetical protein CUS87_06840 [Enterococcus faecium]